MPFSITLGRIAALLMLALVGSPSQARDGALPPGSLDELRRNFTLGGSPIPPLVFRDMGDGNPADIKPILVSVDAWAAGLDMLVEHIACPLPILSPKSWRARPLPQSRRPTPLFPEKSHDL